MADILWVEDWPKQFLGISADRPLAEGRHGDPGHDSGSLSRVNLYTDRDAWQSTADNLTKIEFHGIAPPRGYAKFDTNRGLTISGVKFVGHGLDQKTYSLAVVSAVDNRHVSCWGPGDKLQGGGREIAIFLPPNTTTVGVDVMVTCQAFVPADAFCTLTLSTGDIFDRIPSLPPPNRAFAGVVSRRPIRWMKLESSGTFPLLDGFSFGRE